jgi:hypothetical protein
MEKAPPPCFRPVDAVASASPVDVAASLPVGQRRDLHPLRRFFRFGWRGIRPIFCCGLHLRRRTIFTARNPPPPPLLPLGTPSPLPDAHVGSGVFFFFEMVPAWLGERGMMRGFI